MDRKLWRRGLMALGWHPRQGHSTGRAGGREARCPVKERKPRLGLGPVPRPPSSVLRAACQSPRPQGTLLTSSGARDVIRRAAGPVGQAECWRGGGRSPPETGNKARAQADWAPRGLGKLSPSRAGRGPHRRRGLIDCRPQAQRHPRCYSTSSCLSEMVQCPPPALQQEGRSPRPRVLFPPSFPPSHPSSQRTSVQGRSSAGRGDMVVT